MALGPLFPLWGFVTQSAVGNDADCWPPTEPGGAGRGWEGLATTRLVLGNLVSDLGPCGIENLTSLQVCKTFLPLLTPLEPPSLGSVVGGQQGTVLSTYVQRTVYCTL